ncbi:DNA-3-methyladenine glycosylase family protein [Oceanobacillus halotolerans]|uniref:DNA-3-methyladenine glycosylase family protein n=1 Tax=Oceanobacillus halotolerans TaxID=2663380 RepID=UPI0013DBFF74|nr:DNA-3-methyladenine glycosylase 2 family protein [Oceanobacillus halotolerans]
MENLFITQNDPDVITLKERDPLMEKLITIIGDFTVSMRTDYFQSLVRSIVGQQISVAAASAIYQRLLETVNGQLTPHQIYQMDNQTLRSAGLTGRKLSYIQDLASKIEKRELHLYQLNKEDNTTVLKQLTSIKGVGRWTAEMFLIFSLGRMNVLAVDDIGLQRGAQWLYQVDQSKRRTILQEKASSWDPHLTIASLYLWKIVDLGYIHKYDSIDDIIIN